MKSVMIRYTLREDVSRVDFEAGVADFVRTMHAHDAAFFYTSFAEQDKERAYVHIGIFPNDDSLAAMQQTAAFKSFAGFLEERCAEGPAVTNLNPVASTRDAE